jgi:tetratricopeptide (TPR) repeat protein
MSRIDVLEQARALSLEGDYGQALHLLDGLLLKDPRDVDALRLKGNVIELQIMEREAGQSTKYVYSRQFKEARACYDRILLLQPLHLGALVDLGTHWKNLGDPSKALAYFDKVLDLCEGSSATDREPLAEALQGKIEILREQGRMDQALSLEAQLRDIQEP